MTQISQAIAWTLIHFCWQAAAIAAAYRAISVTVSRRSSQTGYLVALSALLLMLGSAIATFGWELRSGAPVASIAESASNLRATVAADFPRSTAPGLAAIQRIPQHLTLATLLPWIDGLWLIGVFALSIRSLGGWWFLRRLRLASTGEPPAAVQAAFQRISASLGLSRTIALRLSTAIDSPMTMGTVRAIVLLPLSAITLLGPDELEVPFSSTNSLTCAAPISSGTSCKPSPKRCSSSIPPFGVSAPTSARSANFAAMISRCKCTRSHRLRACSRSPRRAALPPSPPRDGARWTSISRNTSHAYRTHSR